MFAILILVMAQLILANIGDECSENKDCDSGEICGSNDSCISNTTTTKTVSSQTPNSISEKAYQCLNDEVKDKTCDSLSVTENIFVTWANGLCLSELDDLQIDNECWPSSSSSSCSLKSTAQALMALEAQGRSSNDAENWIASRNGTPSELTWYLQIDSNEPATCTISYSGFSNQVSIGDDKKLSSGAGSCLSLSDEEYWLRVSPTCSNSNFSISCNQGFITSLLYQKQGSDTIYVSEETHSASAEGNTIEKINSLCLTSGSSCDYEGTLWAVMALDYLDYDVSAYMPYLISLAPENEIFLPDSFLYYITGQVEFRNNLLLSQKSKYWDESGDKFYDTAVALLPLRYESNPSKSNAIDWLTEVQGEEGCWNNNNIQSTAFILASVFPKKTISVDSSTKLSCEDDAKGFCMSRINCDGTVLSDYSCLGNYVCCDTEKTLKTCDEQLGETCSSGESCSGKTQSASGLSLGESCCISGSCQEIVEEKKNPCKDDYDGQCRVRGCNEGEEVANYQCAVPSDVCCIQSEEPEGSLWWIWVLVALIILSLIGILFRERLRNLFMRSRYGKSNSSSSFNPRGPSFPSSPSSSIPQRRMSPRPIFPNSNTGPGRRPNPMGRPAGELDDVLKKLKNIGQ
jgi:hypothetical protein